MDSGVDTSNESDNSQVDQTSNKWFKVVPPLNIDPNIAALFSEPCSTYDSPGKMKTCARAKQCRRSFYERICCSKNRRLLTAAYTNNTELVKKLLEEGANPNATDEQKRSPLHLAACRGYTDVVKTLLKHGADPNITDTIGNTPLHLAACTSNTPVVVNLLNAGTNVTLNDKHGRNPIQLAWSKLQILKLTSKYMNDEKKGLIKEIDSIISMMLKHRREQAMDPEALRSIRRRLECLKTKDDPNVQELLDSLGALNLK